MSGSFRGYRPPMLTGAPRVPAMVDERLFINFLSIGVRPFDHALPLTFLMMSASARRALILVWNHAVEWSRLVIISRMY